MPPRNRPTLSLTPEERDFVGEAPTEPRPPVLEQAPPPQAPAVAAPAAPRARPKVKAEAPTPSMLPARHEAPPAKHRVLQSGELKRTVTGFIPPALGDRLDAYLAAEERTASWVLARALADWLDQHG